jgi:palmitoyl transferase
MKKITGKISEKSFWSANALTEIQCESILKEIKNKNIDLVLIPEIQSVVDVVKAECGSGTDPHLVVRDIIPFNLEGTDLYFEWNEDGKLLIKNNYKFKDTDFAFQYSKQELASGAISFNKNQSELVSKLNVESEKKEVLKDEEKRGMIYKWWTSVKSEVEKIMTDGHTDVYIPFLAYHSRSVYSAERIALLNETPNGAGIGKVLTDRDGNSKMIFVLAHLDSHFQKEYDVGYGKIYNFPLTKNVKLGAGFAAGLISREDVGTLPYILPMVSLTVNDKLSVEGIFIPNLGGENNGAVWFVFGRYTFDKK